MARRWNVVAVAIALVTGLGAALLPLGSSSSADSNGLETTRRVSLLSNEGPTVLFIVAVPALLVALPLLLRNTTAIARTRLAIVILLTVLVVLGALSIGIFFIPTLIAMVVSMSAQRVLTVPDAGTACPPHADIR